MALLSAVPYRLRSMLRMFLLYQWCQRGIKYGRVFSFKLLVPRVIYMHAFRDSRLYTFGYMWERKKQRATELDLRLRKLVGTNATQLERS